MIIFSILWLLSIIVAVIFFVLEVRRSKVVVTVIDMVTFLGFCAIPIFGCLALVMFYLLPDIGDKICSYVLFTPKQDEDALL